MGNGFSCLGETEVDLPMAKVKGKVSIDVEPKKKGKKPGRKATKKKQTETDNSLKEK